MDEIEHHMLECFLVKTSLNKESVMKISQAIGGLMVESLRAVGLGVGCRAASKMFQIGIIALEHIPILRAEDAIKKLENLKIDVKEKGEDDKGLPLKTLALQTIALTVLSVGILEGLHRYEGPTPQFFNTAFTPFPIQLKPSSIVTQIKSTDFKTLFNRVGESYTPIDASKAFGMVIMAIFQLSSLVLASRSLTHFIELGLRVTEFLASISPSIRNALNSVSSKHEDIETGKDDKVEQMPTQPPSFLEGILKKLESYGIQLREPTATKTTTLLTSALALGFFSIVLAELTLRFDGKPLNVYNTLLSFSPLKVAENSVLQRVKQLFGTRWNASVD